MIILEVSLANETWNLVEPKVCKTICYRCIVRKKIKYDGSLDTFKAKIAAKGFNNNNKNNNNKE